jgi:hypothetical protein
MQYTRQEFTSNFITTIGIDYSTKFIEIDGKTIKLEVRFLSISLVPGSSYCCPLHNLVIFVYWAPPSTAFLSARAFDT